MYFFIKKEYIPYFKIKIPKADIQPIEAYTDAELQIMKDQEEKELKKNLEKEFEKALETALAQALDDLIKDFNK